MSSLQNFKMLTLYFALAKLSERAAIDEEYDFRYGKYI